MGYETIEVIRVAGSLGAEARGADLSQPLSDACFSELHDALMAHHLIFLRDQRLSDEQQLAAASRLSSKTSRYAARGVKLTPGVSILVCVASTPAPTERC
jgi:taurine dioxygenase